MFLNLLHLWTGPLPDQELFPDHQVNPLLHWFIHPVKRRIAKYYLQILQQFFGLKVIALTGSSGKTTTTNLLYSVLFQVGPTIKTEDSVTTTYNLPTTILKCTPNTKYLILEMGVEYPGDMDFYCWLAKPDISTVLNISSVHSSFLGTLEQIKSEKYKLQKYSKTFIAPEDFPKVTSSRITSDLRTEFKIILNRNSYLINLPLLGSHFAQNVSAVIKVCKLLGIPDQTIKSGLESVSPPAHRMNVIKLYNGNVLLDDTYNANPLSVSESIKTLAEVSKIKKLTPVFVFGQMNELGKYEKSAHEEIGKQLRNLKLKIENLKLFCLGPATKYTVKSACFGKYFDNIEDLSKSVLKLSTLNSQFSILVKGSHSWHLEKIITQLTTLSR